MAIVVIVVSKTMVLTQHKCNRASSGQVDKATDFCPDAHFDQITDLTLTARSFSLLISSSPKPWAQEDEQGKVKGGLTLFKIKNISIRPKCWNIVEIGSTHQTKRKTINIQLHLVKNSVTHSILFALWFPVIQTECFVVIETAKVVLHYCQQKLFLKRPTIFFKILE